MSYFGNISQQIIIRRKKKKDEPLGLVVVTEDRISSSTNNSFNLARPELITNSQRNDLFTVESFEFKVSWRANTSPTNHITRITCLWIKGILFSSRLIIDKKWLHLLNLYPLHVQYKRYLKLVNHFVKRGFG